MLPKEKIVQVLEAYDLTRPLRLAALLGGVDHHDVACYVAAGDGGLDPSSLAASAGDSVVEPFVARCTSGGQALVGGY